MEWDYRGQQGPGEQVEGGKIASEERAVEAGGMGACLSRRSKTGMRVEYWVLRAVHLSLRVANGRGSQYTEGEGDRSRKKSNSGKGF